MAETISFPVYRKYLNDSSFFMIKSFEEFEEIKNGPSGYKLYKFKVKILPDRNYIHDMLFDFQKNWKEIEEEEFMTKRRLVIGD